MAITLHTLTLPDLIWADELQWAPNADASARALDGSLVVWSRPLSAGRPITLTGTETTGWIPRATATALAALAETPGASYSLTLADGRVFAVRFDASNGPAVDLAQLTPSSKPDDHGIYYIGQIRLQTV